MKVLILGMGKTGEAAATFFKKKGDEIFCFDDQKPSFINNIKDLSFSRLDLIVRSPGISENHIVLKEAIKLGIPVKSDIDIFKETASRSKFIGITGTNGKSTTAALIHHFLSSEFNNVFLGGNIGIPILNLPVFLDAIYVIELSSYQLAISKELCLEAAVTTHITCDHLEWHNGVEKYKAAKARINEGAKVSFKAKESISSLEREYFRQFTQLPGEHNIKNIELAFRVAQHFGVKKEKIEFSLKTFKGLAHRLEFVDRIGNCVFFNDSKATNAESLITALSSFSNKDIFLIAGGRPKADGISPALPYMNNVKEIFLIGEASERFKRELVGKKITNSIVLENAFKNAFEAAKESSKGIKNENTEKIILFSPACASFDQFKNFEERGERFKKLVQEIL